jgi:hypothetical protein
MQAQLRAGWLSRLSVKVISAPKGRRYPTRLAVTNRSAVYPYYRQHDLARRGDKGFAGAVRLLDRECSFLHSEALCLDGIEQNGAGYAA